MNFTVSSGRRRPMTTHNMQVPPSPSPPPLTALTSLVPQLFVLCQTPSGNTSRTCIAYTCVCVCVRTCVRVSVCVCVCVSHTQKPPKAATDDDNKTLTTAATTRKHASFRSILSEREREEGSGRGGEQLHRTLTQVFRITSGLCLCLCLVPDAMGQCVVHLHTGSKN